jgi:hypothetical protein
MDTVPFHPSARLESKGVRYGAVAQTVKKALEVLTHDHLRDCCASDVEDDVVYIVGPGQDNLNIPHLVSEYAGDHERFLVRRHQGLGWEIRRLFDDREGLDLLEKGDVPVEPPSTKTLSPSVADPQSGLVRIE